MSYEKVSLDFDGTVAILKFNDPDALNAVGQGMLRGLDAALSDVAKTKNGARCLLITGEGRGFCSGANLADPERASASDSNEEPDAGKVLEEKYHPLLLRIRDLEMPVVTAVNGPAAGVGFSFAMMGDLILAAKSAYFLQAFRRIGLIPDGGSTWLLPRALGKARAFELSMLGEKLPAEKALEWGLINRVVEDDTLMDEALALAHDLANGPTKSLTLIRKAFWQSFGNSYEQQLHVERQFQKIAGASDDFREGVQAFLEKRPAVFKGK